MTATNNATTIADVMTTNVLRANTNHSFSQLCRMLLELNVHHLPVENEAGELVGIISSNDVLRTFSYTIPLAKIADETKLDSDIAVEELMTPNPITITPEESLSSAIRLFTQHQIQSLPVVKDGQLLGIITSTDVIMHFADSDIDSAR